MKIGKVCRQKFPAMHPHNGEVDDAVRSPRNSPHRSPSSLKLDSSAGLNQCKNPQNRHKSGKSNESHMRCAKQTSKNQRNCKRTAVKVRALKETGLLCGEQLMAPGLHSSGLSNGTTTVSTRAGER